MSAEHTPGPWKVSDTDQESVVTAVGDFYWLTWGHLPHQHEKYGIDPKADARLIAAAPDMLEALELIANTDPVDAALDPQRAVRVARAAIARATGAAQ
jgi:hypothetical protein